MFFLINSDTHCFCYTFCHQKKVMKFCWFHVFLCYDLYFEFYSLNVSNIYYSTIHLYVRYELLLRQHFYSQLLLFYVHGCRLSSMNTIFASIQQFFNHKASGLIFILPRLICLNHHSILTWRIITKINNLIQF